VRHPPESGGRIRPRPGPGAASTAGRRAGSRWPEPMQLPLRSGAGERFLADARAACARASGQTGGSERRSRPPGTLTTTDRPALPPIRPGWSRLALPVLVEHPGPMALLMDLLLLPGAEFGITEQAGAAPS
jgi:hypothetical protein